MAFLTNKLMNTICSSADFDLRSTEADDSTFKDQLDSAPPGGANSSDDESGNGNDDGMAELSGGGGLDAGGDMSGGMEGGDMGGGDAGGDMGGAGGDTGGDMGGSQPADPTKNPFQTLNGKTELDHDLAKLQSAIEDSLDKVRGNPKVRTVAVKNLEELKDSVQKIREDVHLLPNETIAYQYNLATIGYSTIAKDLVNDLGGDGDQVKTDHIEESVLTPQQQPNVQQQQSMPQQQQPVQPQQ